MIIIYIKYMTIDYKIYKSEINDYFTVDYNL